MERQNVSLERSRNSVTLKRNSKSTTITTAINQNDRKS